jgi:hypothetical protein
MDVYSGIFFWKDWEKSRKYSGSLIGAGAELRTWHICDDTLKHFYVGDLLHISA